MVHVASQSEFEAHLSEFGMTLGRPGQANASFQSTAVFAHGDVAAGFMNADDAPLPPVPGGGAVYDVVYAGPGVHRLRLVASPPALAENVTGVARADPLPVLDSITMVTITRWDAAGNVVSPGMFTFEVTAPGRSLADADVYHYPQGAPEGTLLTERGGTVGPCRAPAAGCLRVTAPGTSAFVLYRIGPPPKGYCAPARGARMPGCTAKCRTHSTLLDAAADCDALGAACAGVTLRQDSGGKPAFWVRSSGPAPAMAHPREISWRKDCDECAGGPSVGVAGCRVVIFDVVTRGYGREAGWQLLRACPAVAAEVGTMADGSHYTTAVCLAPGGYVFVAQDQWGDGWEGGTFAVSVAGTELVPPTPVGGWGAYVPFEVPAVPVRYALRLTGVAPDAVRDLRAYAAADRDLPVAASNASGDDAGWGIAADAGALRSLRVWPAPGATLGAAVLTVALQGATGGRLLKRFHFRDPRPEYHFVLPAACGPAPSPHADFADCEHTSGGACRPVCLPGYDGGVSAVCGADGAWALSGACTPAGGAYMMGSGSYGETGAGVTGFLPAPAPLTAPDGTGVEAFALGHSHSAFRSGAGRWYLMGRSRDGQLGQVPLRDSTPDPVALESPDGRAVTAAALGEQHTVFVAGGRCYATGANSHGELGLGHRRPAYTPQPVPAPGGAVVDAVLAGAAHTAFRAGGRWYVFGSNRDGQLGLAVAEEHAAAPRPLIAPGGAAVARVALGGAHTALVAGGRCFVAGANAHGQLGLGHTAARQYALQPLSLPDGAGPALDVVLGGAHSAVRTAARWYVFGRNDRGQLGLGHRRSQTTAQPLPVPDGRVARATAVALGGLHSAFFVDGRVYVMGANDVGQLGLGHTADALAPTPLAAPNAKRVTAVALGHAHSAFVADATYTPSPTASATFTPPPTPTASPNATATPLPTATASPSPTAVPTATASPTGTAEQPVCSPGPATGAGATALASAGPQCVRSVSLGSGSSALQTRRVRLSVQQLSGSLTLHLLAGCRTQGGGCPACEACMLVVDEAAEYELQLSSVSNAQVQKNVADEPEKNKKYGWGGSEVLEGPYTV